MTVPSRGMGLLTIPASEYRDGLPSGSGLKHCRLDLARKHGFVGLKPSERIFWSGCEWMRPRWQHSSVAGRLQTWLTSLWMRVKYMFSTSTPAKIFGFIILSILLVASLRIPGTGRSTELTVLMEPDGTGVWRDIIGRFNSAHPQTPVRLVEGPPPTDSREDMYSTAFLAGSSGYDIVFCDVVWVPKFAAAGWLMDLTDRLAAADRDDFLPADLEAGTYNGRIYRIPAFTDAGLLYYRSDLVMRPPETFEDVFKEASKLATTDRVGYLWQGKQYEGLVTNYLEVLWGYGGEWISSDRRVLLDSAEALEALRFLKSSIGSISPQGVTTYAEEETRNLFQSGRS